MYRRPGGGNARRASFIAMPVHMVMEWLTSGVIPVNVARMDIESLKTVALVARLGSFAAAARALDLDPSSVSRTVSAVEAELNLRLFQRTTRRLAISEEGDVYLRRIAPLLEEFDRAREEAGRTRKSPTGTLRLTASVAFAHECIVPHLKEFRDSYPDLTVEFFPTDEAIDLLANGIDLAIRLTAAPQGDFISTRLVPTRYRVVASADYVAANGPIAHPRDLESLDCLRFALPDFRTRWRFIGGDDAPLDVRVSGRLLISNALALRRAALDGLGPALLADWLVGRYLADGRLVDLFPDYECAATEFDTGAWALYPSRSYLPQKVRVTIDFLRQKLRTPVPG